VAAPELSFKMPLTPFVPASSVRIDTAPLLDALPLPP